MNTVPTMALTLRGTKRKTSAAATQTPKKSRQSPRSDNKHSGSSDSSVSDSEDNQSDVETLLADISTPRSPVSSKQSPKYPSQLKTIHCTYEGCDKSFNRPARLTQHLRSHTNTRPFVCPHTPCDKDFLRDSHLQHHIKSAHSAVRDYVCEWEGCGKMFVTGTRLKRHYAAHEGREKYKCDVHGCGKTFRKHGTLQKHAAVVHEGKKPFACEETNESGKACGAEFETAGRLKVHQGQVHGGNRYKCMICTPEVKTEEGAADPSLGFSTYSAFQAHNKTAHPPTCTHCGTKCATPKELNAHMELFHGDLDLSDRRTHLCPEAGCGHAFTKKGNLMIHLKTVHAGVKAFTCSLAALPTLNKVVGWTGTNACSRAFTSKGNLEEHIRTTHMGLPPSRKGKGKSLTEHEQDPSDGRGRGARKQASTLARLTGTSYGEEADRNIPCLRAPGCAFRFLREYDLDIHMQAKHGLAYFEIQLLRAARDGYAAEPFERAFATGGERRAVSGGEEEEEELGDGGMDVRDWGVELEARAARGGNFWLGGDVEMDTEMGEGEWDRDEGEMKRLIEEGGEGDGDGDDNDDRMVIDPALC